MTWTNDLAFVQVTLTTVQTALIAAVLRGVLAESGGTELPPGFGELAAFFQDVTHRPNAYPPTGKMARSIKMRKRRMKVTAGL